MSIPEHTQSSFQKNALVQKFQENALAIAPEEIHQISKPRHLIDVRRANQNASLDKYHEAIPLMKQAVFNDHSLHAVIKEIGNDYFLSYDMQNAWLWWGGLKKIRKIDTIPLREASKDHLMKSVVDIEIKMKAAHPEFFSKSSHKE